MGYLPGLLGAGHRLVATRRKFFSSVALVGAFPPVVRPKYLLPAKSQPKSIGVPFLYVTPPYIKSEDNLLGVYW